MFVYLQVAGRAVRRAFTGTAWVPMLAPLFAGEVRLAKELNIPKPVCLSITWEGMKVFGEINEIMYVKYLAQHMADGEPKVNPSQLGVSK